MLVLGTIPDDERNHLTRALSQHCRWCHTNGIRVPPVIGELLVVLANDGQSRPTVAAGEFGPHDGEVLLLDYVNAAARLGVSERTVRRLTSTGKLPVVEVAGCRRVRVTDLAAYVEGL